MAAGCPTEVVKRRIWYVLTLAYVMLAHNLSLDFFHDGVTGLDEHYFNAQKDRQLLESSLVIPQLKTFSSPSRHSSKRARLG